MPPITPTMPLLFPCRLIIDPPRTGVWNMAVDECLLEEAADEGIATLRFYQWSEPTLSLGYFQRYADRATHLASNDLPVVRRLSGGGTLLHDRELTYSLCLPPDHPLAKRHQQLYRLVHQSAIEALGEQEVELLFWDEFAKQQSVASHSEDAFLCFQRRTDDDLVFVHQGQATTRSQTTKVVGSAQRRRRGAVLQHGALLLGKSAFAQELSGLIELTGKSIDLDRFRTSWSERIATKVDLELRTSEMSRAIQEKSQALANERLKSTNWLRRK
ncbi:lipoate--protein ligase family protein [Adhaeretor mobilis]|uniref:Octanoyltransferase LipM n=1 Tax=Adhaeretor mobilis TaxID=1930276 RepID=A0A517N256_9BACT|nr:hypothetical protein [Adhaeretor mobilis]QDT01217.1 Octanoyltransferase LipM [Adhaeretor mobilis]